MSEPGAPPEKPARRPRYRGPNPRDFREKYKEHRPDLYADDVARVIAAGKTPAGSHRPILVREVGITVWRFAVLSKRVVPASKGGKTKTVLQSVAITLALAPFPALLGGWVDWVNTVFMAAAFVVTILTGVQYLIDDRRLNRA